MNRVTPDYLTIEATIEEWQTLANVIANLERRTADAIRRGVDRQVYPSWPASTPVRLRFWGRTGERVIRYGKSMGMFDDSQPPASYRQRTGQN